MINQRLGLQGGVVLRAVQKGRDRLKAGATITPEDAAVMPIGNRVALESAGYVQWHRLPEGSDLGSGSGQSQNGGDNGSGGGTTPPG